MTDKISESLRQFIETLVEEVVLEGKAFDDQKELLNILCDAENVDYATLEKNLTNFIKIMKDWKLKPSKLGEMAARAMAKNCYLSDGALEMLMGSGDSTATTKQQSTTRGRSSVSKPLSDTEFVDSNRLIRGGAIRELVEKGRRIVPYAWKCALNFYDGRARVEDDNGLYGYVDTMGNLVIPCKWRVAGDFSESLALVKEQDECCFIDKNGNTVITCDQSIDPSVLCSGFHEGLAVIRQNEKYGFMDKSGSIVIPCKWEYATNFDEGMASVQNDQEKYGCIDTKGRLVIPCQYDEEICFYEGLATIYREWREGGSFLIDKTGRKVCNIGFGCGIVCFQEGLGSIEEYGFIDKNGKLIIEDKWSPEWEGFSEGLAPTEEGFIDHSGQIVIPADWDECTEFCNGLAVVCKNDKYGYIDHSGRVVIPCIWDHAYPFYDSLAPVELAEKHYFINKRGEILCKVK